MDVGAPDAPHPQQTGNLFRSIRVPKGDSIDFADKMFRKFRSKQTIPLQTPSPRHVAQILCRISRHGSGLIKSDVGHRQKTLLAGRQRTGRTDGVRRHLFAREVEPFHPAMPNGGHPSIHLCPICLVRKTEPDEHLFALAIDADDLYARLRAEQAVHLVNIEQGREFQHDPPRRTPQHRQECQDVRRALLQRVDAPSVAALPRRVDIDEIDGLSRMGVSRPLFQKCFSRTIPYLDVPHAQQTEVPPGDLGPQRITFDCDHPLENPTQGPRIHAQSAGQIHGQPPFMRGQKSAQGFRLHPRRRFAAGLLVGDLRHDAPRGIIRGEFTPTLLQHPYLTRDGRVAQRESQPLRIALQIAFDELSGFVGEEYVEVVSFQWRVDSDYCRSLIHSRALTKASIHGVISSSDRGATFG